MSNYETNDAPNAMDFLGSYLKKEDVLQPTVVKVTDVYQDELPDESRRKLVAKFAEFGRPMVLNKTNIKRLCQIFGTTDTSFRRLSSGNSSISGSDHDFGSEALPHARSSKITSR